MTRSFREDLPGVGRVFRGARDQMAGEALLKASSDPDVLRQTLGAGDAQPAPGASSPVIPGSKPTLGQLTGDMGILQAERQARMADNTAFNDRDVAQNNARQAALASAAPSGADAMRPSQMLQSHLDLLDQATDAVHSSMTQRAQDLASRLGPEAPPELAGAAIRGAVEHARGVAKGIRRSLYDAVDPHDDLTLVTSPVSAAARSIVKEVDPYGAPLQGEEQRILSKGAALPDVMRFNSLRAFNEDVTSAMSTEKRASGETPTWRRLAMLKGATQDAINDAVDNQAAHEARAVQAGHLAPEDTIRGRIGAYKSGEFGGGRTAAEAAGGDAVPDVNGAGRYAPPDAGANRNAGPPSGGYRSSPGLQDLSGAPGRASPAPGSQTAGRLLNVPPSAVGERPQSLLETLAQAGGLAPHPELRAIFDRENPFFPGIGRLIRRDGNGMSLDRAHELATESGHIVDLGIRSGVAPDTDINTLLDKIAAEHGGQKQYAEGDNPDAYYEPRAVREAERAVRAELNQLGIDPRRLSRRDLNEVVDLVHSGEAPDADLALERVFLQHRESHEQEATARHHETGPLEGFDLSHDAYGASERRVPPPRDESDYAGQSRPSRRVGAGQRDGGRYDRTPGGGGQRQDSFSPNFDADAGQRLAAAKAFHAGYARTYKEGPAASTLATNGFGDNYKLPAAAVPSKAFAAGDRGYETVKAFMKAANGAPEAANALQQYAMNPLRSGLSSTLSKIESGFIGDGGGGTRFRR